MENSFEEPRMSLSRRQFGQQTLGAVLTYSLLETLFARDALTADMKRLAAQWIKDVNDLSRDLKGQKLEQTAWQRKVDELAAQVDLRDMLRLIDLEKMIANVSPPEEGEKSLHPKLPKVEGLPTDLVFGHQVFVLGKGRSVVPHGHNNMASAFLILQGDFQGRHYDRLEDTADGFIIRPTIDRSFGPGEHSTVSDFKDNIHWFQAATPKASIFNIHVLNVNPGSKLRTGRVYLDPNGEKLSDGRVKARRLSSSEAYKLYG
jgi:hypothetical protein